MVEVVAEALVVQVVEVLPLLATLAAVAAGKTCPRSAKHSRTFRAHAWARFIKRGRGLVRDILVSHTARALKVRVYV